MKNKKMCDCGNKQIEVSYDTKIEIREASDAEKELFKKTYWKWPKEITFQTDLWNSMCEMLNSLESAWFSTSNREIWRKCLDSVGQYQPKKDESLHKCKFDLIEMDDTVPQIRINTTYSHSVEKTDGRGNVVRDSNGNIKHETIYRSKNTFCDYPQDFLKLLDVLLLHIRKKCKNIVFCNNILFNAAYTSTYMSNENKLKKNDKKMDDFIRKNLYKLRYFYENVSAKKQILEGNDYIQFSNSKPRVLDVDGELFFEFNNACGFNIDEKYKQLQELKEECKKEDQRDLERRQEECRQKLEKYRQELLERQKLASSDIIDKFNKMGLLLQPALSNQKKYEEYEALRRFCISYIPQLKEWNFNIGSFHDRYPHMITEKSCLIFKDNWERINRSYYELKKGIDGEDKVFNVLKLYDDRAYILRDYVWTCEHDFIVITQYGIYTIEVKNLSGRFVLTETGILEKIGETYSKPDKDIAMQSRRHRETLFRNLTKCPFYTPDIPIYDIICSAASDYTIQDNFRLIPVCNYNTIDRLIFFREDGTQLTCLKENEKILTHDDMEGIRNYLLENQEDPYEFAVFRPKGEIDSRESFLESFAQIAGGLIAVQNSSNNADCTNAE